MKRKKAIVLGMGVSGSAAFELLERENFDVLKIDDAQVTKTEMDQAYRWIKGRSLDLFVPSPGVSQDHLLYQMAREYQIPIQGESDLGLQRARCHVIGITGTNGKSTAAMLLTHVLTQKGIHAKALGNIGIALTKEISTLKEQDVAVVELSSYQLETVSVKSLDAAIILNISEDHLDRYMNYQEYVRAKMRILSILKDWGRGVFPKSLEKKHEEMLRGYPYEAISEDDIPKVLKEVNKTGLSDESVYLCYVVASFFHINLEEFVSFLQTFQPLRHRLEFIGTFQGVLCYNDSKATNVASTIHAVEKIGDNIILIAGGVDKGGSYSPWKECFENRVRTLILMGEAKEKIAKELGSTVNIVMVSGLSEAIKEAFRHAREGDKMLLSPGCASFDMFKNYVERAEAFIRGVQDESQRVNLSCCSD